MSKNTYSKTNPTDSSSRQDLSSVDELEDFGLFWVGKDDRDGKKSIDSDAPYSKNKKTLILVHGWQPRATFYGKGHSFCYDLEGQEKLVYLQNAWIDRGWNVGIFRWVHFADDDLTLAEDKIYPELSPSKITYREKVIDEEGNEKIITKSKVLHKPISDVFMEYYEEAMEENMEEVRFMGHSLGSQMATLLCHKIMMLDPIKFSHDLRLELLDPYFTCWNYEKYSKSFVRIIEELCYQGIPITWYKSTPLSHFGCLNYNILNYCALVLIDLEKVDKGLISRFKINHNKVVYWYMRSIEDEVYYQYEEDQELTRNEDILPLNALSDDLAVHIITDSPFFLAQQSATEFKLKLLSRPCLSFYLFCWHLKAYL